MVLTEHDYYGFVINLYKGNETEILSSVILKSLAITSLLFFGYSLDDITFRVVFRGLMNLIAVKSYLPRIAVVHPPNFPIDDHPNDALIYLDEYTKNLLNALAYWGDMQDFAVWLREPSKVPPIEGLNLNKNVRKEYATEYVKKMEGTSIRNTNKATSLLVNHLKDYYRTSHAIVIGLSKYKEVSSFPPLPNAMNDAQAIKNILERKYDFSTLTSLFNEYATAESIREVFEDIILDEGKIGPKDRVLIYYSGHGKLRTILGPGGEEIKEGFIVPYDSKREKYGSNISMETIVKDCQKCLAKHVLLILDCCYSGYAATRGEESERPKKATDTYLRDITSRTAIQVLAAGQEDQPVSDSGIRPGYSAFTGALLDILEPEVDIDDNGILTASEIASDLEKRVALQTSGSYQRPAYNQISGSEGGDFIFKIFNI